MEKFVETFKEVLAGAIKNRDIKLEDMKVSHDLGKATFNVMQAEEIRFGF